MASAFRIYAILAVISGLLGYYSYTFINTANISNLTSVLQNVSAMIFTIMGLWVAFIYPEAIKAVSGKGDVSDIKDDTKIKRIEGLVLVILSSAFVMLSLLAYNLLFMLFAEHEFVKQNAAPFKLVAVSFITFLAFVQSKAVLAVMTANVRFVNDLYQVRNKRKLEEKL